MERDEQVTLSPFEFPETDDRKSVGKSRFDVRIAMIAAAHEHAAILRFLAQTAQEEFLALDATQLPKQVVQLGPGRSRDASPGAVSDIVGKLVAEADEWDRRGRELFHALPKRVAERLALPEKERGVATVVRVARTRRG